MLKKKFAAMAAALVIGISANAMAAQYKDLPQGHWAYDKVIALTDEGILHQGSDGLFKGDSNLTRYDFAYMVGSVLEKSGGQAKKATFKDVPASHWAADKISMTAGYEVLSGYGDGTFRGDKAMTRMEIALSLHKLLHIFGKEHSAASVSFSDVPQAHWAYEAVSDVCGKDIMSGYGDGTFRGDGHMTKNEAAIVMVAFLNALQK
ncbi:S-layer homology domain-containing protein [Selenomonas ruminantium]|uniref:S-layer homology domain-containing protein n=1 Tax=Selenomonas ruminantium TaxID=971 RepID=A0A1M6RY52_SELRU|nr:S-layer homology domain-containing protein [Selenomonas ruminantium]SHK37472.1 S-layer homology domain-containing protein [Selenomonas ruminantium]